MQGLARLPYILQSSSPFGFWGGHRFKAKLWLCEEHPLSLCEQVAPIIDLMAVSNALFAKLRDFITLRLPPGFPVKIGENPSPVRLDGDWGSGRSGFR